MFSKISMFLKFLNIFRWKIMDNCIIQGSDILLMLIKEDFLRKIMNQYCFCGDYPVMPCIINDINHAVEKLRSTQGSNYFIYIDSQFRQHFFVGKNSGRKYSPHIL